MSKSYTQRYSKLLTAPSIPKKQQEILNSNPSNLYDPKLLNLPTYEKLLKLKYYFVFCCLFFLSVVVVIPHIASS